MMRKTHFTMIRGFHLADWFTMGNAFCGMGAVLLTMAFVQTHELHLLLLAAAGIVLALIFDALDGRIARWRQRQSSFGRELDSLADVISFGVAPAALAYGAGMQGLWDCLVLLYFVGCGVSRLARYNITAEAFSEEAGKVTYFEGTPIPSSVLLVVFLAVAAWFGHIGTSLYFGSTMLGPWQFHPLVLLFVLSGSLMISKTIRIPKL